ncbi:MAG: gamma-glutamylcyclotransferase [Candidatus Asgardarchaeum sp.]
MKLFVYGTLMHGFNLHFYLKKYPFLGRAIIKGYDLYDLEFFPAIVPGSGIVHGEVYEVDERLMDTLDSVEGVDRENPSAGLYIKEETFAFFGDYKEKVIIYVYNRDLPKDSKLIESGDYTFKKERTGKINYFAYGSDIYTRRMKERSIEILAKYPAFLKDYKLTFNKRCMDNCCANIEKSEGDIVYGALYEILYPDIKQLDMHEKVPVHYRRITVRIFLKNGRYVYAETYTASDEFKVPECPPNPAYLRFMLIGLREIGWLEECERLKRIYE